MIFNSILCFLISKEFPKETHSNVFNETVISRFIQKLLDQALKLIQKMARAKNSFKKIFFIMGRHSKNACLPVAIIFKGTNFEPITIPLDPSGRIRDKDKIKQQIKQVASSIKSAILQNFNLNQITFQEEPIYLDDDSYLEELEQFDSC